MNQVPNQKHQHPYDIERRKAELEAALEEEVRISRRQIILKKLWKLDQNGAQPDFTS